MVVVLFDCWLSPLVALGTLHGWCWLFCCLFLPGPLGVGLAAVNSVSDRFGAGGWRLGHAPPPPPSWLLGSEGGGHVPELHSYVHMSFLDSCRTNSDAVSVQDRRCREALTCLSFVFKLTASFHFFLPKFCFALGKTPLRETRLCSFANCCLLIVERNGL